MALFGNEKNEKKDAPATTARREESTVSTRAGDVHTLLGKGSEFEGKLSFEGQVRIDGKYSGQIATKDVLVIGEGAKVMAEIQAGTVIIHGTVEGNIKATGLVELHPPARVKGSIETPALSMDKGVIFEGTSKMENLSKASGAPAAAPAAAPVK
ncbi:MAG: polymer-forming cytoskeletal protein [Myxococcaceae bacterium]|nr:polymer-forming cytoskeletal protein [Myxococcaceae bacterium]